MTRQCTTRHNAAKERPIIFSAPMVRAILEGRKTQTRRVVKFNISGRVGPLHNQWHVEHPGAVAACPYGQPGDLLWVQETFFRMPHPADCGLVRESIPHSWDVACAEAGRLIYRADGGSDIAIDGMQWKPSIHMPRRASRITLEVTSVRVERLQDISKDDAIAEGCDHPLKGTELENVPAHFVADERTSFARLWQSINGAGSWGANPWVWVVAFKRANVIICASGTRR